MNRSDKGPCVTTKKSEVQINSALKYPITYRNCVSNKVMLVYTTASPLRELLTTPQVQIRKHSLYLN